MEIHQKYLLKNNEDNDLVNSEKDSIYVDKRDDSQSMNKVEKEYKTIREMQLRTEEEEAKKKRALNENEVEMLREGLLKKLEQLKISYAGLTHKGHPDTLVMKNK